MKTVFIDSDVILDFLAERQPHYSAAAELFQQVQQDMLQAVTTPIVYANLFYLLERHGTRERAHRLLRKLRQLVGVIPVDQRTVDAALTSDFADFEDALQYYAAVSSGAEALLTRNLKDYSAAIDLAVCTPAEFLGY